MRPRFQRFPSSPAALYSGRSFSYLSNSIPHRQRRRLYIFRGLSLATFFPSFFSFSPPGVTAPPAVYPRSAGAHNGLRKSYGACNGRRGTRGWGGGNCKRSRDCGITLPYFSSRGGRTGEREKRAIMLSHCYAHNGSSSKETFVLLIKARRIVV